MSRTLKDAPYPTRARRHGREITDHLPSCARNSVHGERFTAVFYAHEQAELAEFRARAEELGYEVAERERGGFLSEIEGAEAAQARRSPLTAGSGGALKYALRRVVDRPKPSKHHLVEFADGTVALSKDHRPKRNIFIIVEAEKLHYAPGRCWHGEHELDPGSRYTGRMRSRMFRRSRRA